MTAIDPKRTLGLSIKMHKLILILISGLVFITDTALASSQVIKNRNDKFVEQLETIYIRYRAATKNGDVAAFKNTNSKRVVKKTDANIQKMGGKEKYSELLQTMLYPNVVDITNMNFIVCELNGNSARLLYWKEAEPAGKQRRVGYVAVKYMKENGKWVIDAGLDMSQPLEGDPLDNRYFKEFKSFKAIQIDSK